MLSCLSVAANICDCIATKSIPSICTKTYVKTKKAEKITKQRKLLVPKYSFSIQFHFCHNASIYANKFVAAIVCMLVFLLFFSFSVVVVLSRNYNNEKSPIITFYSKIRSSCKNGMTMAQYIYHYCVAVSYIQKIPHNLLYLFEFACFFSWIHLLLTLCQQQQKNAMEQSLTFVFVCSLCLVFFINDHHHHHRYFTIYCFVQKKTHIRSHYFESNDMAHASQLPVVERKVHYHL